MIAIRLNLCSIIRKKRSNFMSEQLYFGIAFLLPTQPYRVIDFARWPFTEVGQTTPAPTAAPSTRDIAPQCVAAQPVASAPRTPLACAAGSLAGCGSVSRRRRPWACSGRIGRSRNRPGEWPRCPSLARRRWGNPSG